MEILRVQTRKEKGPLFAQAYFFSVALLIHILVHNNSYPNILFGLIPPWNLVSECSYLLFHSYLTDTSVTTGIRALR